MSARSNRLKWRKRARRLLLAIATITLVLCAQVTRIVAAGFQYGSMQCCCGVHQSDEDCGCPDCPVAHAGDHNDAHGLDGDPETQKPVAPSLNRCGPTATVVALMADVPWVSMPITHDVLKITVTLAATLPPPMISTLLRAPDAPPPR